MLDSLVTLAGAGVAAGVAFVGIPVALGAVGFTGAGIAAGTLAAKMMSAAAIANGGGVAAGSAVAVLQSIGPTKRSRYPSDQGVWVSVSVMVGFIPIAVGATVGFGVATVAVPAALGAVGFTGAGIAGGTLAAKMMSAAAIANGGGVAAGSAVAMLQSVGKSCRH
ncbi:interferon alpha-inducible protein 27-like protein 1 [Pangshura tecta]